MDNNKGTTYTSTDNKIYVNVEDYLDDLEHSELDFDDDDAECAEDDENAS